MRSFNLSALAVRERAITLFSLPILLCDIPFPAAVQERGPNAPDGARSDVLD